MKCSDCIYADHFQPREDEKARGLTLGCKYPGYEGYTDDNNLACGGSFFKCTHSDVEMVSKVPWVIRCKLCGETDRLKVHTWLDKGFVFAPYIPKGLEVKNNDS